LFWIKIKKSALASSFCWLFKVNYLNDF
jgi:hypothetical protein